MRNLFCVIILVTFMVQGCATITPEAKKVVVHSQVSNLLDDCERLGNVSATVSGWSKGTWEDVHQQAKNDIRDQAFRKYGADTVAIVNTDKYATSITVQGIAFKCGK
ncbi:MAG: DUF4156 domain-containing protein [Thermodesulfobacteriota bacterium]